MREGLVSEALDRIRRDDVVKLCRDLVRIRSETGHESEIADFISGLLEGWGFEVKKYEVAEGRPNVIGFLRGSVGSPSLMLNGHMDTVPIEGMTVDPLAAEVRDGKIYGRGAADMKGGLASMLLAAKAVKDSEVPLNGDLVIAAVIDEEGRGLGTSHLRKLGLKTEYGIVVEPTSLDIVIAHKGERVFELTVKGKPAHGSTPELGVNAIYQMTKAINNLLQYAERLKERRHPLLGYPTINIGRIEGGTHFSVVPESCRIQIDRRFLPGESPEAALKEMDAVLMEIKKSDPSFEYELRLSKDFTPEYGIALDCSPEEPVVKALLKAGEVVLHKRLNLRGASYTTDASLMFSPPLNIKTVVFGPGAIEQAHSSSEYVEINELLEASRILALAIINLGAQEP